MEGKSHRVGGVLAALGGYYILKEQRFLIEGVTPLVQLAIIYPFSIVGSLLPDQDHHKESAPMKDVISLTFNKVLHLTTKLRKGMRASGVSEKNWWYRVLGIFDAKHRSWQTHSDLSFALMCLFLLHLMSGSGGVLTAEGIILKLISMGLVLGLISHLILDMLTPSGVWCLAFVGVNRLVGHRILPEKIRFVPNRKFFSTGGRWEEWWRFGMGVVSFLLFFYILYTMLPYKLDFYGI